MISQYELNESLMKAISDGQYKNVVDLISMGADVNAKGTRGQSPIHYATLQFAYKEEILDVLLDNISDINLRDDIGLTPLHLSSLYGKESAFRLIERGADVNATDDKGRSPLHYSASEGHLEISLALIKKVKDLNLKEETGATPLNFAVENIRPNTVLALMAYGGKAEKSEKTISKKLRSIQSLTMHQAAAKGGFTDRVLELIRDHPSSFPGDDPDALLDLAKRSEKAETAAGIHSFLATRAIWSMLHKNNFPRKASSPF